MHITLHLSNKCNLRCRYCYVEKGGEIMATEILRKAIDLAAASGSAPIGVALFGGEPLLHRDLIREAVDYCRSVSQRDGRRFLFKLTTNGTLLDEAFLDYADKSGIFIAVSIDGTREAHDMNRTDAEGKGTYGAVAASARELLKRQICSPAMMVVNPETVKYFAEGVDNLFRLGFRYSIPSLNFAADWDSVSLRVLKSEYRKLADWYFRHTMAEDKFYLSPFEAKFASHIKGGEWCRDRCELGMRRISVAPDGSLYPCVQFVGEEEYKIGHVDTGIDEPLRLKLFEKNRTPQKECEACAIKARCLNTCGCLNKQVTGSIDRVAPSLCAHERILLPIADRLAEKLYKKRNALFIQKNYNDMYPLISALEDSEKAAYE